MSSNLRELVESAGWKEFAQTSEEELFRILDSVLELDPTNPQMPAVFGYYKGRIDAIVALWKFEKSVREVGDKEGETERQVVETKRLSDRIRAIYRRILYR